MQRLMDPLAGAKRNKDGSLVHTVTQSDMDKFSPELNDEAAMIALFEKAKTRNDVWDIDEEDQEAY